MKGSRVVVVSLIPVPSKEGSARRGLSEIMVEITCDYKTTRLQIRFDKVNRKKSESGL